MWDVVGKPLEPISKGKDCSGIINEKPGGVAFNIALGSLWTKKTTKIRKML